MPAKIPSGRSAAPRSSIASPVPAAPQVAAHHQAVGKIAEPLQATGVSDDGIVESLELNPDASGLLPFLLAVQFHPERLASCHPEHRAFFRAFTQACVRHRTK